MGGFAVVKPAAQDFFFCRARIGTLGRVNCWILTLFFPISMKSKEIIVFSTSPDEDQGRAMARTLVSKRLAACVNVVPRVTSIYRWEDQVREDPECLLIIKSTGDQIESLTSQIEKLHPYELPEVLVVPITGGLPAYLDWVRNSVLDGS
jgi:periplasmic divalent cation tolerance protein